MPTPPTSPTATAARLDGIPSRSALVVAFVALFTDMLIYGIAVPVLPRFPAVSQGGAGTVGLLFALYAAGLVLATPFAGRWVDRDGPRSPLLVGLLVLAAATLLFSVAEPVWLLALARFAQGVSAACSWVAGLALVSACSPLATRARNLGLVLSATSLGVLLGPPLGGLLADLGGRHLPFLAAAGLAMIDGVLRVVLIRTRVLAAQDDPASVRDVARVPGALAVCAVVTLGAGLLAVLEPVLPRHLSASGTGSATIGLVFGAAVFASALSTPVAGSLSMRVPIPLLTVLGTVIASSGMVLVAIAASVVVTVLAMVLLGLGSGMVLGAITPVMTTLGERSRPPAIGAAFALFNLSYATGLFVGPTLSGAFTQEFGFAPAVAGISGLCVVCALLCALLIHRRVPRRDP